MRKIKNHKRILFLIEEKHSILLEKLKKATGLTMSELIREALDQFFASIDFHKISE